MVKSSWLFILVLSVSIYLPGAEPEGCDRLHPSVKTGTSMLEWLLLEEHNFKRLGCWKQHLQYGEKAIKEVETGKQPEPGQQPEPVQQQKLVMRLSLQMASSSFYLGNYEKAQQLADRGYQLAIRLRDKRRQIEGLYLLSAIARSLGRTKAIELAEQSLMLYRQSAIQDKQLEAKVYMNLGAAFSDVSPPLLDKARHYLQKAYQQFLDEQHTPDALRAGLRVVRVDYLQNQLDSAHKRLNTLKVLVDTPRAEMLFAYQMAKVLHRQKQWGDAAFYANKAKRLAHTLNARKDGQRVNELLKAINERRFLAGNK